MFFQVIAEKQISLSMQELSSLQAARESIITAQYFGIRIAAGVNQGINGGLIFIDEIDKKAKDGALFGHDISREGFQKSVLKLIERKLASVNSPYSPVTQNL